MPATYHGSCHCGAVTFEADLDLTQPTFRCNCTICRRTRFWAAVARPEAFRLLSGEGELAEYRFGGGRNQHFFCRRCGVRPFGRGNDTPIGPMIGVNVGCLDELTDERLSALTIVRVDNLHDRPDRPPAFADHL
jgi:hypothetical protein